MVGHDMRAVVVCLDFRGCGISRQVEAQDNGCRPQIVGRNAKAMEMKKKKKNIKFKYLRFRPVGRDIISVNTKLQ